MNEIVSHCDIVFVTLDTLRFDVAQRCFDDGRLPNLASRLPSSGWQKRHTPGSFTYAAHHAFFAGFLPTPATPGKHPRLFASAFRGSETTATTTYCFDEPNLVHALESVGYDTLCAGGVGFFNKQTKLGSVLPDLFRRSAWSPEFGVTDRNSFEHQIRWVADVITDQLSFVFINVSAIHQPNYFYLDESADRDTVQSHDAALCYVDSLFPDLWAIFDSRPRPTFYVVCSDHGTAYGEDDYHGHRLAHPTVWDVPYTHFLAP